MLILIHFVQFAQTELGQKALVYSALYAWDMLKDWELSELISLSAFKSKLRVLEANATFCFYKICLYLLFCPCVCLCNCGVNGIFLVK